MTSWRRQRLQAFGTISLFAAFLLSSCAGRKTAFTYLPPKTHLNENAPELKRQAEAAWQHREKTGSAQEALEKYQAAYDANPSDTTVAIRLAEAYFFVAEYVMLVQNVKSEIRQQYYERGLTAGERALELHADFRAVNRDTRDEEKALEELRGEPWTGALFWTFANMERWDEMQNLLRQTGNKQRLEIYRKRMHSLDDQYYYGGVYRLSGKIDEGGTQEAHYDNAYEKALANSRAAADFFPNYLEYAVRYAIPKKKGDLARELLDKIAKGDPKGIPENFYAQELASNILKTEEKKLNKQEEKKAKSAFKPRY